MILLRPPDGQEHINRGRRTSGFQQKPKQPISLREIGNGDQVFFGTVRQLAHLPGCKASIATSELTMLGWLLAVGNSVQGKRECQKRQESKRQSQDAADEHEPIDQGQRNGRRYN